MAINDDIFDWIIRRNLRLFDLTDQKLAQVANFFRDVVLSDIAKELTPANFAGVTTMKARLAKLRSIIVREMPFNEFKQGAMTYFSETAQREASMFVAWMNTQLPAQLEMIAPAPNLIESAIFEKPFDGEIMSDWFNRLEAPWRDGIYRDFRSGLLQGKTIPQMAKFVREGNIGAFSVGNIKKAIRDSKAVVRTASTMVTNRAREMTYTENTDLIKGVRYVAFIDIRTTLICMNLNGNLYPVGEGLRPPQHWNCRSTTIPEVKSWREMGLPGDDSRFNGRPALQAEQSIDEIAKGWSEAEQNKRLGPVRAQLWRDGKVDSLQDFMASTTRVKTLKEMGYTTAGNPLEN